MPPNPNPPARPIAWVVPAPELIDSQIPVADSPLKQGRAVYPKMMPKPKPLPLVRPERKKR